METVKVGNEEAYLVDVTPSWWRGRFWIGTEHEALKTQVFQNQIAIKVGQVGAEGSDAARLAGHVRGIRGLDDRLLLLASTHHIKVDDVDPLAEELRKRLSQQDAEEFIYRNLDKEWR